MEQMLENFTPGAGASQTPAAVGAVPVDLGDRLVGTLSDRLSPTVTALREAVEVLSRREPGGRFAAPDRSAEELSRVIQQTMAVPIQELNQAIHMLARSVEELKRDPKMEPEAEPRESEFESTFFDDTLPSELEEEPSPDDSMSGLRWFANWRQSASMKGAA